MQRRFFETWAWLTGLFTGTVVYWMLPQAKPQISIALVTGLAVTGFLHAIHCAILEAKEDK